MSGRHVIKKNKNAERTGLGQYLSAVKKHDIVPTKPIRATDDNQVEFRPRGAGEGEIPVVNVGGDVAYLMEISIGTPAQTLHVNCDTGSADFWIVSKDIVTETGAKKYHIFDPKKSTSFKKVEGATWKMTYGDGTTANGTVGTDIVQVAGIDVHNQAIELPSQASLGFITPGIDGLVGLGFRSNNGVKPSPVSTLVEKMVLQNALDEPLFAVKLVRGGDGEFHFGFIDQNDVKGEIAWTPVDNKKGYWIISSEKARINGKVVDRPADNQSMIDTGTTICLLDDEVVEAIYDATPGAFYDAEKGGYQVPTGTVGPTVELFIGGRFFQVPGDQIARKFDDSGISFGAFQSRGKLPFDIIGVTFLRNTMAIFDVGNLRFGCAERPDVKYDDVSSIEEDVSRLKVSNGGPN